jgi:hypothetical protein
VGRRPARIKGYVSSTVKGRLAPPPLADELPILSGLGARIYKLPRILDMRGSLSVAEFTMHLPSMPPRYFLVVDVPSEQARFRVPPKNSRVARKCQK